VHPSKLQAAKITHQIEPSVLKRTFSLPRLANSTEKYASLV
jgi:hypothetical protein